MTDAEQNVSPDEQVYQSTKSDEPAIKTVYDNQPDDTKLSAGNTPPEQVDELSAESFPASDPPATVPTASATRIPESGDAALSG